MKRNLENQLNEKLQVKLPDSLSRDNILKELHEETELKTVPSAPKTHRHFNAKRYIALAASLAIVFGAVGVYFGMSIEREKSGKAEPSVSESADIVQYQGYDEIYKKFNAMRKEYKKNNLSNGWFGNGTVDDAKYATDEMVDSAKPGNAENEAESGSIINNATEDKRYGTTNRQELDVDESDIIKTDGRYLYVLNTRTNLLHIIDCAEGKMTPVSSTTVSYSENLNGESSEMFLNNGKIIIVGMLHTADDNNENSKCYRYDMCDYYYSYTGVSIYDVTDKAAPKQVNSYVQEGNYNSCRMINSKLYCVSTHSVNLESDNLDNDCIPHIINDGKKSLVPADCISVMTGSDDPTYAIITTLDTASENAEPSCEAVLGSCDNMYATSKNIYLTQLMWNNNAETKIHKFEYTETGVRYKATGKVDGRVVNQFAMGAQGDFLRVAVTDVAKGQTSDTTNALFILDNDMKLAGSVQNLADGEQIRSVRYVGNMAYIVTFLQTDPLFTIDTTDPYKPEALGELKVTGFSEYMHPMGDGLLIGIGPDGTESGTTGNQKVSLFDVSDPKNPKELSKATVADKGYTYSELGYNHKLFIELPDNRFAVPFSIESYLYNYDNIFRYIVYEVKDNTVTELARYTVTGDDRIAGATYIENIFYVVNYDYIGHEYTVNITSFDMETNEQLESITLREKNHD